MEVYDWKRVILLFPKGQRELKQNIRSKIEEDAIMQHIAGKEERDGKPELGVKDVALAFALYKRWRKIRKFTEE